MISVNMDEVNYQRQVDSTDQHHAAEGLRTQRCHREIHFPFLAERYERLEDEERVKLKEERKKRKKKQYKKVRKVGVSFYVLELEPQKISIPIYVP